MRARGQALRVGRHTRTRRAALGTQGWRRDRSRRHGRIRSCHGQQLQRRAQAARDLLPRWRGARGGQARELRRPDRPRRGLGGVRALPADRFNIGLLGYGTVGSAFATLLEERAGEIERFNERRPVISGVLTRARGSFEEILAGADLLVELMGGIEPAREYLLTAMRAGKDVVSANKALLSQHGEELFETARERGVRLRFEAAVAGVVTVVRVIGETLSATPIEGVYG